MQRILDELIACSPMKQSYACRVVYSFAVVLTELLTGRETIDLTLPNKEKSLAAYFKASMKENRLFQILHHSVLKEGVDFLA